MRANEFINEVKQRLDAKCWKGKHKEGTKIKGGVRVNNCVPNESVAEGKVYSDKAPKLSGLSFDELDRLAESAGADNYSKFDTALKKNLNLPSWTNTLEMYGVYLRKLNERAVGKQLIEGQQTNIEQQLFDELNQRSVNSMDSAAVGNSVALLHLVTLNIPGHKVVAKLNGFLAPKKITKITNSGSFQQLEFADGSKYPEKDGGDIFQQTQGWNMTKLFPTYDSASKAYLMYALVGKKMSDELDFETAVEQGIEEEWSKEYKDSINCSNPKGFSQKAHCAGKKKHNEDVLEETYHGDEFYEAYGEIEETLEEAEYHGRKVPLGKPMRGDVKKYKTYVRDPKTGNIKKVNFGDPNMRIRKSNPARRKSFRARHNCANPGPRTKARYWSCRNW